MDPPPDWGDFDRRRTNYDAIYNAPPNDGAADVTVIGHLLTQINWRTNLADVTLPVNILEPRSLLEMYADFFAHPDELIAANYENSAEKRFLAVVKYYLNSLFPGRRGNIAKKPYNPILGETFRCRWTLPRTRPSTSKTTNGPFPGSATNQLTFIAEQVSHHPPISAFHVDHREAGVSCTTYIHTKSSFSFPSSICAEMLGKATLKLHNHDDETYTITFPTAYGRSILTTPFFELGGTVELRCDRTNYRAEITFHTAGIYVFRRPAHQIDGKIYLRSRLLMKLKGEWTGLISLGRRSNNDYTYQHFTDVRAKPSVPKECVPVMQQQGTESRKLWRHVTAALFNNNTDLAGHAKRWLEQRQRDEAEERAQMRQQWQPQNFARMGNGWRYLGSRIAQQQQPSPDSKVSTESQKFRPGVPVAVLLGWLQFSTEKGLLDFLTQRDIVPEEDGTLDCRKYANHKL
ncbi:hypothetical protein GPALN_011677 [Globodera pallida]|nr:hypothetical protein GPALN_011677 [Globodera pallida]